MELAEHECIICSDYMWMLIKRYNEIKGTDFEFVRAVKLLVQIGVGWNYCIQFKAKPIHHLPLITSYTVRTFQGYVFEEPWCSSSKGRPIYVLSNAKPNELLIEAEFFASIHKSTYTYSCPTPAPPSGCTYHPHPYIHAAAAPSQPPSCPSQGPHTPAAPPMLMG